MGWDGIGGTLTDPPSGSITFWGPQRFVEGVAWAAPAQHNKLCVCFFCILYAFPCAVLITLSGSSVSEGAAFCACRKLKFAVA